jgi:hypothetical protein
MLKLKPIELLVLKLLKFKKKYVSSNCEPARDRRRMKHSSLESSRRDASNGGKNILLWSLDGPQYDDSLTIRNFFIFSFLFTEPYNVSLNFSASSDHRKLNYSSLDSSNWDKSNDSNFNFLWSLDAEKFNETLYGSVNKNEKIKKFRIVNESSYCGPSSDHRRMYLPPFDASRRDDSNELCFIFLWSLAGSQFDETYFLNFETC